MQGGREQQRLVHIRGSKALSHGRILSPNTLWKSCHVWCFRRIYSRQTPRNKTPVSWHSWSLGSGFVRKGQAQSWHGSADVLFARRGGSQDSEAVSPSGARDNRGGSLRRLFPLPLCQTAAEECHFTHSFAK